MYSTEYRSLKSRLDVVFGKYAPQIMAIAVAVAMFGFAAVTGAAAVWMQIHLKQNVTGVR